MIIGERLRIALNSLKISNKELSSELEVTPQYLSALKNQDKLTDTIVKIAELKKISLDWLVFGIGSMSLGESNQQHFDISGNQSVGNISGGVVKNKMTNHSEDKGLQFYELYQLIENIAAYRKEEGFDILKNKLITLSNEMMPHA